MALVGVALVALAIWWLVDGGTPDDEAGPDDLVPLATPTPIPSPTAVATPTATNAAGATSLTVRPLATGGTDVLRIGRMWPVALTAAGDVVHLVTSPTAPVFGSAAPSDVEVWRSDDGGSTWQAIDSDLPAGHRIGAATSDIGRLVLAGTDTAGNLTVWTLRDGAPWVEVPVDTDDPPLGMTERVVDVDLADGVTVITTGFEPDYAAIGAAVGLEPDAEGLDVTFQIGTVARRLPLGLPSPTLAPDDPALTDQVRAALASIGGSIPDPGRVLVVDDDGVATAATTPTEGRPHQTELTDGGALTVGAGSDTRPDLWSSEDLRSWDLVEPGRAITGLASWREGIVGTAEGSSDLLRLDTGGDWVELGLVPALPPRLAGNHLGSVWGGPEGLALTAVDVSLSRPQPASTALLVSDGFTLEFRADTGLLTITGPDGSTMRWNGGGGLPDGMQVDLANDTLAIAADEASTVVTFDELSALEAVAGRSLDTAPDIHVVATIDGRNWFWRDIPDGLIVTTAQPVAGAVLVAETDAAVGPLGDPLATTTIVRYDIPG